MTTVFATRCAAALTLLAAASLTGGCGGGGSSVGSPVGLGSTTTTITSTITPATVTTGNATVQASAGSLPVGTVLTVRQIDLPASAVPAPSDLLQVVSGSSYLITNSAGTSSGPVTISIGYNPQGLTPQTASARFKASVVANTAYSPEDSLRVAALITQGGHSVWVANLINNSVDKTGHVVSAQLQTASPSGTYGLVMLAPPAPPTNL